MSRTRKGTSSHCKRTRCPHCRGYKDGEPWVPHAKRERIELSEPIHADSRDTDMIGIAADLRLMAHEITRDLARDGRHLRAL